MTKNHRRRTPNRTATRKTREDAQARRRTPEQNERDANRTLHGIAWGLEMAYRKLTDGCSLEDIRLLSDLTYQASEKGADHGQG